MKEIVVDSSAIFALALGEPEGDVFKQLLTDTQPIMSVATRVEIAHVALGRFGPAGVSAIDALLVNLGVRVEPLDEDQAAAAVAALLAFGKGRRAPPAVLNMGDSFSYALAKMRGLPLLYKGDDFAQTDIRSALDPEREPAS